MNQPVLLELRPVLVLGLRQLTVVLLALELLDSGGVGMNGDQSVQNVESDLDGLAVPEVPLAGGVLVERLAINVLGN
jgi:hypothetical protein